MEKNKTNEGQITQIMGPVVDVRFSDGDLPEIYNALEVVTEGHKVILEVSSQLGANEVRAISMTSTGGLQRGQKVKNSGAPIAVPVGPEVLGRMFDGIEYRGFGQEIVEELAKYAGVPVWNGLTNEYHPTQMLADMLTIREHFGHLKGIKLVYMGDARYNMGNSLMIACAKLGMHFVACTCKNYFPNEELVETCKE